MKEFVPQFTEGDVYRTFLETDPIKAIKASLKANKKAVVERKDKDYDRLGVTVKNTTVVSAGSKDAVMIGELSPKSFFFPIFGLENVGKSTFATRLAISLMESQNITITRIQLENTVLLAKAYEKMPPKNEHRVHFHEIKGELYVRVFPELVTEDKLIALLKGNPYVFIDGMARLNTNSPRLAERGINLDAINIGIQKVPYLVDGSIVVFTIQSPNILKDLSAASQGYIQVMNPTEVEVSSPFRRNRLIKTSWSNAIEAFFLERDSENYNATEIPELV